MTPRVVSDGPLAEVRLTNRGDGPGSPASLVVRGPGAPVALDAYRGWHGERTGGGPGTSRPVESRWREQKIERSAGSGSSAQGRSPSMVGSLWWITASWACSPPMARALCVAPDDQVCGSADRRLRTRAPAAPARGPVRERQSRRRGGRRGRPAGRRGGRVQGIDAWRAWRAGERPDRPELPQVPPAVVTYAETARAWHRGSGRGVRGVRADGRQSVVRRAGVVGGAYGRGLGRRPQPAPGPGAGRRWGPGPPRPRGVRPRGARPAPAVARGLAGSGGPVPGPARDRVVVGRPVARPRGPPGPGQRRVRAVGRQSGAPAGRDGVDPGPRGAVPQSRGGGPGPGPG